MKRRQAKDLETARQRRKSTEKQHQLSKADRVALIPSDILFTAERDPVRLTMGTRASSSNKLTSVDLEDAEHKRMASKAHDRSIHMTGRDLQFLDVVLQCGVKFCTDDLCF